jgi:iron complex outermembrane recepter protein
MRCLGKETMIQRLRVCRVTRSHIAYRVFPFEPKQRDFASLINSPAGQRNLGNSHDSEETVSRCDRSELGGIGVCARAEPTRAEGGARRSNGLQYQTRCLRRRATGDCDQSKRNRAIGCQVGRGFDPSAASDAGVSRGIRLGARYTLILLNGRRMAGYTSGSEVNLASIPLAAVERVEVLTDGASAIYGSDAIAGVVNFILKKNQTDFVVEGSFNAPQQAGAKSSNFSISKGFGDLERDRYNVLLAYAHDEQQELNASQREFAKSGVVDFDFNGQRYRFSQLAVNTTPASVTLALKTPLKDKFGNDVSAVTFSPNYLKDGKCGPNSQLTTVGLDKACWFDFPSTVQLIPKTIRDSVFASFNYKLGKDMTVFGELVSSDFKQYTRFAPPAQAISLPLTDPLYAKYVAPNLANFGIDPANVSKATTNNRFVGAGGRADLYKTEARHYTLGVEGAIAKVDYNLSYVHSESDRNSYYNGGYMSRDAYLAIRNAGKFNNFEPGDTTELFAPAVLHELNTATKTKLDVLSLRGSMDTFALPGGVSQLGAGTDFSRQYYRQLPAPITMGPNSLQPNWTDTAFGASPGALPSSGTRSIWGVFTELLMPVHKRLDLTAAARYDSYSATKNDYVFDTQGNLVAPDTQGNAFKKVTYKFSFRFRPIDPLLMRGSIGSGFKAPDMTQITAAISDAGVTSGRYPCPVKAPDPRAADCKGNTQYDLLSGGNPLKGANGLKPETSVNTTFGAVYEPFNGVSVGFDFWDVKLKNQIAVLPETFPFQNPAAYDALFSTVFDAGQGQNKLATLLPFYNLAGSRFSGIDWDHNFKTATAFGPLTLRWAGTYTLKSEVTVPGTPVESSVGRFDAYFNVTSRVISRVTASLKTKYNMTHALTWNYRSGYDDMVQTPETGAVSIVKADGTLGDYATVARTVSAYSTFDWQTRYEPHKNLVLTVGVKNLLNQDPPFSIHTSGGGNQSGYDGRFASPLGRQFYISGSMKF